MQVLRLLRALLLAAGVLFSLSVAEVSSSRRLSGGNAACGSARVRKPWESLTEKEQSLYIEALGLAIKNGVVKDLAAMHLETMGETQAHHSCGFFVWHRRMLLAFESYLRDLDPKFACLTIPYYDVHSAYVKAANKQCKNMYDCSPIFKAIGGAASTSSGQKTLQYNGEDVTGFPHKAAPFKSDCDDSKSVCGSMLRDNLQKKPVPSGAGFGSFLDIVTRSPDYATFLENIQFGIHNEIHNAVGGAMATFASPRDVFFYSWHAAIDMYLSVYTQCQVTGVAPGTQLTDDQLKTSLLAFTEASQSCGGVSGVGAEASIVMNLMVDGELVDASQHPTLGKYFSHVGDSMWQYGDTQRLGDYSYSYELPSIIKTQVLSNQDVCKGLKVEVSVDLAKDSTIPPLKETAAPPLAPSSSEPSTSTKEPTTTSPVGEPQPAREQPQSTEPAPASVTPAPESAATTKPGETTSPSNAPSNEAAEIPALAPIVTESPMMTPKEDTKSETTSATDTPRPEPTTKTPVSDESKRAPTTIATLPATPVPSTTPPSEKPQAEASVFEAPSTQPTMTEAPTSDEPSSTSPTPAPTFEASTLDTPVPKALSVPDANVSEAPVSVVSTPVEPSSRPSTEPSALPPVNKEPLAETPTVTPTPSTSATSAPATSIEAPATLAPSEVETPTPHSGIIVVEEPSAPSTTAPCSKSDVSSSSSSGAGDAVVGDGVESSVATSGNYWQWVKTTYDGLMERFDGDMELVAHQMRVIECMAFDAVFGVREFSDEFVKNFHLASNQPVCGRKIDAVATGALTVAVEIPAADFTPDQVQFAAPEVIEAVKQEAAATADATEAPHVDPEFAAQAEEALKSMQPVADDSERSATAPETEPAVFSSQQTHPMCE